MEEFRFLINKTSTVDHFRISFKERIDTFVCNEDLLIKVSNDFLKENYTKVDLSFDNIDSFIKIINKQRRYPKTKITYEIGKYITCQTEEYAKYAKALYLKINRRNRLIIQTFCLFCIRYHKYRINKDIRRKICEYIIDFID